MTVLELRVGRDYTPQYRNLSVFDPFENNGIGTGQTDISIITGVTQTRASNSIAYLWNTSASGWGTNSDGVYGSLMYYMGENSSGATEKDGTGYGLRTGYAAGPFNIAAAVSKTTYNTVGASGVADLVGDVHQNNIGASYNFGVATAIAEYSSDKNGSLSGKGYLAGATVPVGPPVLFARPIRRIAQSNVLEALGNIPTTAHLVGGAVIGADIASGVIDRHLRVFGYSNLLVCDGAAMPANPGVNPALTITALAEYAMEQIPAAGMSVGAS